MQALDLIGFPGEVMLRLLKMLVLPLVSVSMVAGVCSLRQDGSSSGDGGSGDGGGQGSGDGGGSVRRLARLTAAFYIGGLCCAWALLGWAGRCQAFNVAMAACVCSHSIAWTAGCPCLKTPCLPASRPACPSAYPPCQPFLPPAGSTALAILVGILLVVVVHPGRGAPFDRIAAGGGGGRAGDCRTAHQKEVAQHAAGGWVGAGSGRWRLGRGVVAGRCVFRLQGKPWRPADTNSASRCAAVPSLQTPQRSSSSSRTRGAARRRRCSTWPARWCLTTLWVLRQT